MRVFVEVLSGTGAGRAVELPDRQPVVIGRGTDVGLSMPADTALSRRHAELVLDSDTLRVRDLASKHGTFVNGQRVDAAVLREGDRVQVGEVVLRVGFMLDGLAGPLGVTQIELDGTMRGWDANRASANGIVATPTLPAGHEYLRLLGRGAMGSVHLVRHLATGELRAIKQILPQVAMPEKMRAMFLREASVQAQLDHPNIVKMFGVEATGDGTFSIIMEYVDGPSGDALIQHGATLAPALVVSIAMQVLSALAYAHARQIVHRDIKEDNIMLCGPDPARPIAKLADFGLAKNFHASGASGITTDGAMGGTLPYMSREQLLDFRYVKPPADLYGLGATLYRLLTGCYPRDYREGENWILTSLESPVVPVQYRPTGIAVPLSLCAIVERALEPKLEYRYQTAEAMYRDLEALRL